MTQISIALATYNGADYLQAQLDSFISQSRQPDELVVSDDCSTDHTVRIIEAFAQYAPFKVIIHRNDHNHGYCQNFNQALLRTTGDLVFLSDQDDVWFPKKIERMAAFAAEDPQSLIVMNDAALTTADLVETGLTKLGQIRSAGFKESSFVMGCCAAVKRELLDLCLPIPKGYPTHDGWLVGIANGLGRRRIIADVLQFYRRHGQNESQWIVNRTSRVSHWHLRLAHCRRLYDGHARSGRQVITARDPNEMSPLALMCDWAKMAAQRTFEPLSSELWQLHAQLVLQSLEEVKLKQSLTLRETIRQQRVMNRLLSITRLWLRGGYKDFSGLQSALRDLTGR